MANDVREPKAGGRPASAKHQHGKGWLAKRKRHGLTWAQRKARSARYCRATAVR